MKAALIDDEAVYIEDCERDRVVVVERSGRAMIARHGRVRDLERAPERYRRAARMAGLKVRH